MADEQSLENVVHDAVKRALAEAQSGVSAAPLPTQQDDAPADHKTTVQHFADAAAERAIERTLDELRNYTHPEYLRTFPCSTWK